MTLRALLSLPVGTLIRVASLDRELFAVVEQLEHGGRVVLWEDGRRGLVVFPWEAALLSVEAWPRCPGCGHEGHDRGRCSVTIPVSPYMLEFCHCAYDLHGRPWTPRGGPRLYFNNFQDGDSWMR